MSGWKSNFRNSLISRVIIGMDIDQASPSANKVSVIFFFLICFTIAPAFSLNRVPAIGQHGRKLLALVPSMPLVLQYHRGALLTGLESINVYIFWYGNFNHSQKATVSNFIGSIGINVGAQPSVNSWWATTHEYRDLANQGVSPIVKVGGQASDALCSLGKKLERSDIAYLVRGALAKRLFPSDAKGIYDCYDINGRVRGEILH